MKNVPNSNYFRKSRVASQYKEAAYWILGVASPLQPTRMLSNVIVFDGWTCSSTAKFARQIIESNPLLTLRELQIAVLKKVEEGILDYPYVWWIYDQNSRTRAIHEDVKGRPFVKLGNKWQLAHPVDAIAGLAGAQGVLDYEKVPKSGYFVVWENEEIARSHVL